MASKPIPREIKSKDKMFIYLSWQQFIYVVCACILLAIIYLSFKPERPIMFVIISFVGFLVYKFGWNKNETISMEGLILKYAQSLVYNSTRRIYRTNNRYISVYNAYYNMLKERDNQDKWILKAKKKQAKQINKELKKCKIKPIM